MKKTTFAVAGLVLASTILGGAISVSAVEQTGRSTATTRFTILDDEGVTDPGNPIEPGEPGEPGGPGGEDGPGPGGPGEPGGPLRIDYASNFFFNRITFDPITGGEGYAMTDTWTTESGTTAIPNFVQVTDNRANNAGWSLTVAQQGQFQGGSNNQILSGAALSFSNIEAETRNESRNPRVINSSFMLDPVSSDAVELVRADATTPSSIADAIGIGTSMIRFGNAETMGESVHLSVPGGLTVEENAQYSTTLVWTLQNTPQG